MQHLLHRSVLHRSVHVAITRMLSKCLVNLCSTLKSTVLMFSRSSSSEIWRHIWAMFYRHLPCLFIMS